MQYIVSTRFNNNTWKENVDYRLINNVTGCCYGAPYEMSPKISLESLVFVVEMNNCSNQIAGIGLVRNKAIINSNIRVHSERNYNRYIFNGKYRIERAVLERLNPQIVVIFDHILFKEKTHLKRGIGFTTIPEKLLQHSKCIGINLKNEIKVSFIHLFGITSIPENIKCIKCTKHKTVIIVEDDEFGE